MPEDANSLLAIAGHALANAEDNVLGTVCGESVQRERAGEFLQSGVTAEQVRERWEALHQRISTAMGRVKARDLTAERRHPRRGLLTGREVLIVAARHAAEHQGEAELDAPLCWTQRLSPRDASQTLPHPPEA